MLAVSDAKISKFTGSGVESVSFEDLNQYFIEIDYTSICEGYISFTVGSGEIVKYKIDDLFALGLSGLQAVEPLQRMNDCMDNKLGIYNLD